MMRVTATRVALLALLALLALFATFVQADHPEVLMELEAEAAAQAEAETAAENANLVRGVWVSTHRTRGYAEAFPISVEDGVKTLVGMGFNRLYWNAYTNGAVHFFCPECNKMVGTNIAAAAIGDKNDQLSVAIKHAQGKKIKGTVVGWLEYSFLVQSTKLPANAVYKWAQKNKLLLMTAANPALTKEGGVFERPGNEFVEKHHIWLDARKPMAQDFVVAVMCAALKNYPTLGGVQLDDHFGMPSKSVGAKAGEFTAIAKNIVTRARACLRPGQFLSLSPGPILQARPEYNVDWHSWGKTFDEYVPQTYSSGADWLSHVEKNKFPGMPRYIPAIAAVHSGVLEPWSNLHRQLEILKKANSHLCMWVDIAVRKSPLKAEFTKYFGGAGALPLTPVAPLVKVKGVNPMESGEEAPQEQEQQQQNAEDSNGAPYFAPFASEVANAEGSTPLMQFRQRMRSQF